MSRLDRAWLLAHIPHQGHMCLLDGIADWSPAHIHCHASSHRDADNPLRAHGRLGVACGIEYAAQAMAAHGALLADASAAPRVGYLASVRGVDCAATRFDDVDGDLQVHAERLSGDDNTVLYAFSVDAPDGRRLLAGRATVVLNADGLVTAS